MQVEYINPFIIGALEVFEQVANIELKKTSILVKSSTFPENEIAIVMGVHGYLTGQVVYSFKDHTAQRVVACMMPNSTAEQQNEYLLSAIASMANMITGRATILLAGRDKIIYLTPPIVKLNSKNQNEFLQKKSLSLIFSSRFGSIEINVSLALTAPAQKDKP
jgi:CheY-specific phosphatase CheX